MFIHDFITIISAHRRHSIYIYFKTERRVDWMDRWVDRAIKWSYFVGTSLRHPVLGWGASSSLTGLVDSCWIWNERRNTHCFFLPNIGEAADRSPENNARKMRLWSTSSHWEVLQPKSWRKGIRASSLITWLSGAPRFPWTLSAPFLSSFRVTASQAYCTPPASHPPHPGPLQTNPAKGESRISGERWSWRLSAFSKWL